MSSISKPSSPPKMSGVVDRAVNSIEKRDTTSLDSHLMLELSRQKIPARPINTPLPSPKKTPISSPAETPSSSPNKRFKTPLLSRGKSFKTPILKSMISFPSTSNFDLIEGSFEYQQPYIRSKPIAQLPGGPTMPLKRTGNHSSESTISSIGSISSPEDFRVLSKSRPPTPVDQSIRVDSPGAFSNSISDLTQYNMRGTPSSQQSFSFPLDTNASTARLPSANSSTSFTSSTSTFKTYVCLKNSESATRLNAKAPTPRVPFNTRSKSAGILDEREEDDRQVGLGILMKPHKPWKVERSSADSSEDARSRNSQAESVEEYTEVAEEFVSILRKYRQSPQGELTSSDAGFPVAKRAPTPPGDPLDIIDDFLEDNYRGQAETFNSISNRSSSVHARSISRSTSTVGHSHRSPYLAVRCATTTPSSYETPTRTGRSDINLNLETSQQRSATWQNPVNKGFSECKYNHRPTPTPTHRTPSGRTIIEPYRETSTSGLSPALPGTGTPHHTYGHRIYQVPADSPIIVKRQHRQQHPTRAERGLFYFTEDENIAIQEEVNSAYYSCGKHEHCTDCRETAYSFLENKAMPTSMPPEERQKVINNNRSLRNIKNELENLAEAGAISDDIFDQIMGVLPSESSLGGSSRANTHAAPSPSPAPTNAFQNMHVADPAPPSYSNSNSAPAPPSLPTRKASTPTKPEIARATALYRYAEPDDCNFEVGDTIVVYEYMNADWWLGKNVRTGKEGVFPVTYVQTMTNPDSAPNSHYGDEKKNGYPGMAQQQNQGPPPPGPSNPYNSAVPPMQIAEQPSDGKPGKGGAMGKKFGKKLGNAAIFGAGATIGGNIVNSIF